MKGNFSFRKYLVIFVHIYKSIHLYFEKHTFLSKANFEAINLEKKAKGKNIKNYKKPQGEFHPGQGGHIEFSGPQSGPQRGVKIPLTK